MKIKSQKDCWSGLMFVVVGIGFAWGATSYSFGASARPGPGYFPFGLGILIEDDEVDGEMLETFGQLVAFANAKARA